MNKTEEELIRTFMQANKHEIADKGFSRRIMHRLPKQAKNLSDILIFICLVLSGILFYVYDGARLIYETILPLIQQTSVHIIEILNFQTLIPIVAIITYFSIQKAIAMSEEL